MIEKYLIDLKDRAFHGLVCLSDKRVFFYTATLDDYWRTAIKSIFDMKDSSIVSFPSVKFVQTGQEDQMQCIVHIW